MLLRPQIKTLATDIRLCTVRVSILNADEFHSDHEGNVIFSYVTIKSPRSKAKWVDAFKEIETICKFNVLSTGGK